ncbi:MAG: DUF2238 domain-containing protein, partial [Elusimicrobiota bacterium]
RFHLGRRARGRRGGRPGALKTSLRSPLAWAVAWPAAAVVLGQGADAFLGTQGDAWDTQADMLMALAGAVSAQLSLSSVHDRQIQALPGGLPRPKP